MTAKEAFEIIAWDVLECQEKIKQLRRQKFAPEVAEKRRLALIIENQNRIEALQYALKAMEGSGS